MSALRVFISHAHEDRALAEAWQSLIVAITDDEVRPWYSSDQRIGGGAGPGEWRKTVCRRVGESTTILALLTPGSNERPWLMWESGLAEGRDKEVVPVTYFMNERGLHEVFRGMQWFEGDKREGVRKLAGELLLRHRGGPVGETALTGAHVHVERYLAAVQAERRNSLARGLFHDHFHDRPTAERMQGTWTARWTETGSDGRETAFESDHLDCWTTDSRIRFVGVSAKAGIAAVLEPDEDERHYPMEGVVSADGWVALAYWSAREIRICGTVVLRPIGSTGILLEGHWQGHSARHLEDEPRYLCGRVVMGKGERGRELVARHWSSDEASDSGSASSP